MSANESAFSLATVFAPRRDGDVPAALLRQILDRAPAVTVVAAGPELRIVYANRAAEQVAGCKAGALTGRGVCDAFAFIDPIRAMQPQTEAQIVADGQGAATVWWEVSYLALECIGSESAVLITAVDVTHHELAKAQAERAQNTLDALLAYLPDGISIAHGSDVHVERISARGLALVGRSADELTGKSALQQTAEWEVYRPGGDLPLPRHPNRPGHDRRDAAGPAPGRQPVDRHVQLGADPRRRWPGDRRSDGVARCQRTAARAGGAARQR